jgi:hypothetical protein
MVAPRLSVRLRGPLPRRAGARRRPRARAGGGGSATKRLQSGSIRHIQEFARPTR